MNIDSQISSKHFKPVLDTELIYQANEIFYLGLNLEIDMIQRAKGNHFSIYERGICWRN